MWQMNAITVYCSRIWPGVMADVAYDVEICLPNVAAQSRQQTFDCHGLNHEELELSVVRLWFRQLHLMAMFPSKIW